MRVAKNIRRSTPIAAGSVRLERRHNDDGDEDDDDDDVHRRKRGNRSRSVGRRRSHPALSTNSSSFFILQPDRPPQRRHRYRPQPPPSPHTEFHSAQTAFETSHTGEAVEAERLKNLHRKWPRLIHLVTRRMGWFWTPARRKARRNWLKTAHSRRKWEDLCLQGFTTKVSAVTAGAGNRRRHGHKAEGVTSCHLVTHRH